MDPNDIITIELTVDDLSLIGTMLDYFNGYLEDHGLDDYGEDDLAGLLAHVTRLEGKVRF